jgi:hypothetical protein
LVAPVAGLVVVTVVAAAAADDWRTLRLTRSNLLANRDMMQPSRRRSLASQT